MKQRFIEISQFKQFLSLVGSLLVHKECAPPEPDFSFNLNGKYIGVEHTRLYLSSDLNGNDLTKHQKAANRIIATAEESFKKLRNEELTVSVNFASSYGLSIDPTMLTMKDVKELSVFMLDFVLKNVPEYNANLSFEQFDMEKGIQILPDKIKRIRIYNQYDCWSHDEAGMVPDIRSNALYDRVASKDTKIPAYRLPYDEVWLLIVEDQSNITNYFNFSNTATIEVNSRFNRVFILRAGHGEIVECINLIPKDQRWPLTKGL